MELNKYQLKTIEKYINLILFLNLLNFWGFHRLISHRLKTNHYIIQQLMHLCSMEKLQQIKTSRRLQILKKFMDANLSVAKVWQQENAENE